MAVAVQPGRLVVRLTPVGRLTPPSEKLAVSKLQRDMCVYVADMLRATAHCQTAARKASAALRLLKMAFPTLKISNFKQLYTTYVHPHIE